MPAITCYLSTSAEPIGSDHPLWSQPLPDNRDGSRADRRGGVTYRGYFEAIIRFCCADDWSLILRAAALRLGHTIDRSDLTDVSIFLAKHGAFYHPARLKVNVGNQPLAFVVNMAVSAAGNATLSREVAALMLLKNRCPFGWLPEVYGNTTMTRPDGGRLSMFLGPWFEGFHEFHLTRPDGSPGDALVVWDGAATPTLLRESEMDALYRQAAMILTACYDPVTTEQIFPWHHAAGDFVIRRGKDKLSVRLITARGLVRVIGQGGEVSDEPALFEALAMFMVHLTLRMRLDRRDGIGTVVWAPDSALPATLDGFYQGLDLTARLSGFPETFPRMFRRYMESRTPHALEDMAMAVVDSFFQPGSEEQAVVHENTARHVTLLRECMVR